MSYIFPGGSLSFLPDISKWKAINVTNMSFIFEECKLLSELSDISKWNINNVTNVKSMLGGYLSLISYLTNQNGILIMFLL